jgi:hypothetical protein
MMRCHRVKVAFRFRWWPVIALVAGIGFAVCTSFPGTGADAILYGVRI